MQNVYRHFDKDHNLLYVGMSLNVVGRLAQHKQHAPWFEKIVSIEIEKFSSRKDAFMAEGDAIRDENPMYNIRRPMSAAEIEIQSKYSFDNPENHTVISYKLFGEEITQHIGTGFLSSTDLIRGGNKKRAEEGLPLIDMSNWFNQKRNQNFLSSLEDKFGVVKVTGIGRGHHTWVHPYLFTDFARAFGPKLKVEFYIWMMNVISDIKL